MGGRGECLGWGRGAPAHLIPEWKEAPEAEWGPSVCWVGQRMETAWEAGRPDEGALPSPWERPRRLGTEPLRALESVGFRIVGEGGAHRLPLRSRERGQG